MGIVPGARAEVELRSVFAGLEDRDRQRCCRWSISAKPTEKSKQYKELQKQLSVANYAPGVFGKIEAGMFHVGKVWKEVCEWFPYGTCEC